MSVGDGRCDDAYNLEACMWDGGDCCQETCSNANYDCGVAGFTCRPNAVYQYRNRNPLFLSSDIDMSAFRALFAWAKAKLAKGCEPLHGESLSYNEWLDLLRAFNRGTVLHLKGKGDKCRDCEGGNMCGPDITELCARPGSYNAHGNIDRALFVHEMMHTAGYFHHSYKTEETEEWGECNAIGSWYDSCSGDRCKIHAGSCTTHWHEGCTTHWHEGSQSCGFLGLGCQARCVKARYSMTAAERARRLVHARMARREVCGPVSRASRLPDSIEGRTCFALGPRWGSVRLFD